MLSHTHGSCRGRATCPGRVMIQRRDRRRAPVAHTVTREDYDRNRAAGADLSHVDMVAGAWDMPLASGVRPRARSTRRNGHQRGAPTTTTWSARSACCARVRRRRVGRQHGWVQPQLSQTPVSGSAIWQVGHGSPTRPPTGRSPEDAPPPLSVLPTQDLHAGRVRICSSVAGAGVPRTVLSPHSKCPQSDR